MSSSSIPAQRRSSSDALHASFLASLLRIQRHGCVYFRDLKNEDRREEAIAEMVALCSSAFRGLTGCRP
jgi:hypothetical protein